MEPDILTYLNTPENKDLMLTKNGLSHAYKAVAFQKARQAQTAMETQSRGSRSQAEQSKAQASFPGQTARTRSPKNPPPTLEEEIIGGIMDATKRGNWKVGDTR
jgi:hypothetical protein